MTRIGREMKTIRTVITLLKGFISSFMKKKKIWSRDLERKNKQKQFKFPGEIVFTGDELGHNSSFRLKQGKKKPHENDEE